MRRLFTRMLLVVITIGTIMPMAGAIKAGPALVHPDRDTATVKAAIESFRNLSKKERRERLREVKKVLKEYKAAKRRHEAPAADKTVQIIFAILIPPLGVFLHEGVINGRFWIDLLLTLIFYVPGLVYALIIVLGD